MKFLALAVCSLVFAWTPCALAQDGGPAPPATSPSTQPGDAGDEVPFKEISSVAGIVVCTILGVGVLKKALAEVKVVQNIPNWVLAIGVSFALTLLATQVLHSLKGDFWATAYQAAVLAATASGFRSWLFDGLASPKISAERNGKLPLLMLLGLPLLALNGCGKLTVTQQYQLASDAYVTTTDTVTTLSKANLITLKDMENFNEWRKSANDLLNEWQTSIVEGRPFGQIEALQKLLDLMLKFQLEHKKKKEGVSIGPYHSDRYRAGRDPGSGWNLWLGSEGNLRRPRSDTGGNGDGQLATCRLDRDLRGGVGAPESGGGGWPGRRGLMLA